MAPSILTAVSSAWSAGEVSAGTMPNKPMTQSPMILSTDPPHSITGSRSTDKYLLSARNTWHGSLCSEYDVKAAQVREKRRYHPSLSVVAELRVISLDLLRECPFRGNVTGCALGVPASKSRHKLAVAAGPAAQPPTTRRERRPTHSRRPLGSECQL